MTFLIRSTSVENLAMSDHIDLPLRSSLLSSSVLNVVMTVQIALHSK